MFGQGLNLGVQRVGDLMQSNKPVSLTYSSFMHTFVNKGCSRQSESLSKASLT